MKKILITGENSYIGTAVKNWLLQWKEDYSIDEISLRNDNWKQKDFSNYDVVLHVAGIAHVPTADVVDETYNEVNYKLTTEVLKKAKQQNVKQFIFMSSLLLYGIENPIGADGIVDENTIINPLNAYAKSKADADRAVQQQDSKAFHTVCIRTPMVYGKGCKGNFVILRDKISKLPILPYIENQRSMIHIENLANFIKERIDKCDSGVFFPQNKDYVRTNDIIKFIRASKGMPTYESKMLGALLKIFMGKHAMVKKAYGNLTISKHMSSTSYIVNGFEESLNKSM